MRFTVIDNFHSEEFGCDYVAGMSYEARDGDDKLKALIPKWIEEGKIREGGPGAAMSAQGEVSDPLPDHPPPLAPKSKK